MAINFSLVSARPIFMVVGNVYVSSTGGNVVISSPQGTIAVGGTLTNPTIDIAQQGASTGQVLTWNGTQWAPATNNAAQEVFSGKDAPSGITPTVNSAIYYDTVSTQIYEWVAASATWVLASGGSGGAQYLFQLRDVSVQESGGSFGTDLLNGGTTSRIVGYTDSYLQLNTAIAVVANDRLASQNTNPSNTLVVQSVQTAGSLFQINFAGGVFAAWAGGGTLIQSIFKYTPTVLPSGRVLQWNGTAWVDAATVNSLGATGEPALTGAITLAAGSNVTLMQTGQVITISSSGGGGGGSFSQVLSRWTNANATSKNAQTSPGNINNDGITINLVASANPGTLTAWTITLNGTALPNTYTASGSFPNYSLVVPVGDITGNAIQTASTVTVALSNTMFNLTANNLTNAQPVAFTTVLTGSYSVSSAPFYVSSALINYSYTNTDAIISFGGSITPTGGFQQNATAPSGSFANQPINGATIGGTAIGNGLNGAGQATVNLTGSIPALATFVPAWLSQTANNTPPAFTTTDATAQGTLVTNTRYQTAGAAQGTTLTYPTATAMTQFNWICTQRPLANLMLVTPLGNTPLTPDVTAPAQTIGGQTFQVYGWSGLGVGISSVLQIG